MTDISTTSWSEIDASNTQSPPEGWPAGMFPNAVEGAARMHMGAMKRTWNRLNPVYTTTQTTSDAYVLTPSQAVTGYGLYERWRARFNIANASTSPTIVVSALGPLNFVKYSGGSKVALAGGDIQAQDHEFWYDGAGNALLINPAVPVLFSKFTNTLGGDVALNNQVAFFDGPSVAQGLTGIWLAIGKVTLVDTAGAASFVPKLWDGTTVVDTAQVNTGAINAQTSVTLAGIFTNPTGNIRVSATDQTSTSGKILANGSGQGHDSSLTVIRIG